MKPYHALLLIALPLLIYSLYRFYLTDQLPPYLDSVRARMDADYLRGRNGYVEVVGRLGQ